MNCDNCTRAKRVNHCANALEIGVIDLFSANVDIYVENTASGYIYKQEVTTDISGLVTLDMTEPNKDFYLGEYYIYVTKRDDSCRLQVDYLCELSWECAIVEFFKWFDDDDLLHGTGTLMLEFETVPYFFKMSGSSFSGTIEINAGGVITIDFGDGTITSFTGPTAAVSHTYTGDFVSPAIKTILISGDLDEITDIELSGASVLILNSTGMWKVNSIDLQSPVLQHEMNCMMRWFYRDKSRYTDDIEMDLTNASQPSGTNVAPSACPATIPNEMRHDLENQDCSGFTSTWTFTF